MDDKYVSLAALESAMMHLQETNKRLARITVLVLVAMLVMFGTIGYFFTAFEVTTEDVVVDSDQGNANYIGNDGSIVNESGSGEEDDYKK